jgi:hypothetical protein
LYRYSAALIVVVVVVAGVASRVFSARVLAAGCGRAGVGRYTLNPVDP